MPEQLLTALKQIFGYSSWRDGQAEIIAAALAGRDCFVLLPTGGGKSLCYQLPALQLPKVTVVVSPLMSLMKDQVDTLQANGIAAAYVNSSLSREAVLEVLNQLRYDELKLLYVAPERVEGKQATVQSDVYGLGLVLYEMLVGKPPFTSTTIGRPPVTSPGLAFQRCTSSLLRALTETISPLSRKASDMAIA